MRLENTIKFKKQTGFSLIEIGAVLIAIGALSAAMFPQMKAYFDDRKIYNDAEQVRAIGVAAQNYIEDNYSAILSVATPTSPALITIPMLVSTGYLPTGTTAQNNFDQSICALVKEPTAGKLQALLVAEGGESIDDLNLNLYAGSLGGSGGLVSSINPTQITGVGGSWSIATNSFDNLTNDAGVRCDGSTSGNVQVDPGHNVMALWLSAEESTSGVLYRDNIPSRPELNRMNTDIDMDNNSLNNIDAANASSITASTSITAPVFIDTDDNSFRIDPNGTSITNRIDVSTIYDRDDNGFFIDPSGNSRLNVIRPDYIEPQTTVTEGTACSPNGRIAMDSTGKTLSCQSSMWTGGAGKPQINSTQHGWYGYYYGTHNLMVPDNCFINGVRFTNEHHGDGDRFERIYWKCFD